MPKIKSGNVELTISLSTGETGTLVLCPHDIELLERRAQELTQFELENERRQTQEWSIIDVLTCSCIKRWLLEEAEKESGRGHGQDSGD